MHQISVIPVDTSQHHVNIRCFQASFQCRATMHVPAAAGGTISWEDLFCLNRWSLLQQSKCCKLCFLCRTAEPDKHQNCTVHRWSQSLDGIWMPTPILFFCFIFLKFKNLWRERLPKSLWEKQLYWKTTEMPEIQCVAWYLFLQDIAKEQRCNTNYGKVWMNEENCRYIWISRSIQLQTHGMFQI